MVALAKQLFSRVSFLGRREESRVVVRALPAEKSDRDKYPPVETAGLFAQLTPEQRAKILAYNGPIGSGRADLPAIRRIGVKAG